VKSSAGSTFDRIHAYVAGAASAFERNRGAFERSTALLVFGRRASHAEACQASAGARQQGKGDNAFDRKNCVRLHCQSLIF
jgi:hypothetical protein